jgi:hypothetical protein
MSIPELYLDKFPELGIDELLTDCNIPECGPFTELTSLSILSHLPTLEFDLTDPIVEMPEMH